MKKITITNAGECINTGENEDLHFQKFEIDGPEEMDASDGYHTFTELYDHRITLFIALCSVYKLMDMSPTFVNPPQPWRSKKHSDGSEFDGWFILGLDKKPGEQKTYHLPISRWEETDFAETLDQAPEWDGHTSADVLDRLKKL
jgi:hypothetical protein